MRCYFQALLIGLLLAGPALAQQRRDVTVVVPEQMLVWEYHAFGIRTVLGGMALGAAIVALAVWIILRSQKPRAKA